MSYNHIKFTRYALKNNLKFKENHTDAQADAIYEMLVSKKFGATARKYLQAHDIILIEYELRSTGGWGMTETEVILTLKHG